MMGNLNSMISRFWPCPCSFWCGYLLAPFSLGLSFLIPNMCMKDAKEALEKAIIRENTIRLNAKGLELRYRQFCSTSWIELEILTDSRKEEIERSKLGKYNDPDFTYVMAKKVILLYA